MRKPSIDEVLSSSRPAFAPSVVTSAALDELVLHTREAANKKRSVLRRKSTWLIPATVLTVGALTAGAFVVDRVTRIEQPIPVSYTTDTGVAVSCTAYVASSAFTPELATVTDYYASKDFTDPEIGQRIYEYALVLNGEKHGTTADLPASVAWLPDDSFVPYGSKSALFQSMFSFIIDDVVLELDLYGHNTGSSFWTDCAGQLH